MENAVSILTALMALLVLVVVVNQSRQRPSGLITPEQIREIFNSTSLEQLTSVRNDLSRNLNEQLQTTQQGVAAQNEQAQRTITARLEPVAKQVEELAKHVTALEKAREVAYSEVNNAIAATNQTLAKLSTETSTLTNALANGKARGSWGELQLRKIVEMVGLEQHISYEEQRQVTDEGTGRPDITVSLPGKFVMYIDSKVPMDAYLRSLEASDPATRDAELKSHATAVASHIRTMKSRSYQAGKSSLDFTVLFIPVESALSAACEVDPELIEKAAKDRVVLAAPTSLIAILTNIATSWQQHNQATNSEKILDSARELHSRLNTFSTHLAAVGKGLTTATEKFNQAVSSYDSRVMPAARKIEELGQLADKIVELPQVETVARELKAVDDFGPDDSTGSSIA